MLLLYAPPVVTYPFNNKLNPTKPSDRTQHPRIQKPLAKHRPERKTNQKIPAPPKLQPRSPRTAPIPNTPKKNYTPTLPPQNLRAPPSPHPNNKSHHAQLQRPRFPPPPTAKPTASPPPTVQSTEMCSSSRDRQQTADRGLVVMASCCHAMAGYGRRRRASASGKGARADCRPAPEGNCASSNFSARKVNVRPADAHICRALPRKRAGGGSPPPVMMPAVSCCILCKM